MPSITPSLTDHFLYLGKLPRQRIETMYVKGDKLFAFLSPDKIEDIELGSRRLVPLQIDGSIEDSLVDETIHAVMNKMRKNFGSLIQECKIELNEDNDATVLTIENHKIFEQYIEKITKDIVALNTDENVGITQVVKEHVFSELLPLLYFGKELERMKGLQIILRNDQLHPPRELSKKNRELIEKQLETATVTNEIFLNKFTSSQTPSLNELWEVVRLNQHAEALHESIDFENIDSQHVYHEFTLIKQEVASIIGKSIDEAPSPSKQEHKTWLNPIFQVWESIFSDFTDWLDETIELAKNVVKVPHLKEQVVRSETEKHCKQIIRLRERMTKIESAAFDSDEAKSEFLKYRDIVENMYQLTVFRIEYYNQTDLLEDKIGIVCDQIWALHEGSVDFSTEPIDDAMREIDLLRQLAEKHKQNVKHPVIQDEIEELCNYKIRFSLKTIEDLSEQIDAERSYREGSVASDVQLRSRKRRRWESAQLKEIATESPPTLLRKIGGVFLICMQVAAPLLSAFAAQPMIKPQFSATADAHDEDTIVTKINDIYETVLPPNVAALTASFSTGMDISNQDHFVEENIWKAATQETPGLKTLNDRYKVMEKHLDSLSKEEEASYRIAWRSA